MPTEINQNPPYEPQKAPIFTHSNQTKTHNQHNHTTLTNPNRSQNNKLRIEGEKNGRRKLRKPSPCASWVEWQPLAPSASVFFGHLLCVGVIANQKSTRYDKKNPTGLLFLFAFRVGFFSSKLRGGLFKLSFN